MKKIKVLALAIVAAMLVAMVPFTASAATTSSTVAADMQLVQTLKIMTDGRESDAVKRGEFAKMMCIAKTGGRYNIDSYADDKCFDDITGHWSAPYVNFLKNQQLVDGVSAKKFSPEATITVRQAIKMALSIIGYNFTKDVSRLDYGKDEWQGWTVTYGMESGLLDDNVTEMITSLDSTCTRAVAAEIIVNALFASQVNFNNAYGMYIESQSSSGTINTLATSAVTGFNLAPLYVNVQIASADPVAKSFSDGTHIFTGAAVSLTQIGAKATFYAKNSGEVLTTPTYSGTSSVKISMSNLVYVDSDGTVTVYKSGHYGSASYIAYKAKTSKNLPLGRGSSDGSTIYFVGEKDTTGAYPAAIGDGTAIGYVTAIDSGTYHVSYATLDAEAIDATKYDCKNCFDYQNITLLNVGDVFVRVFDFETGLYKVTRITPKTIKVKSTRSTSITDTNGTTYTVGTGGFFASMSELLTVISEADSTTEYTVYVLNGGIVYATAGQGTVTPVTDSQQYLVVASYDGGAKMGTQADVFDPFASPSAPVNGKVFVYFTNGKSGVYEVASYNGVSVSYTTVYDSIDANCVYTYTLTDGKLNLYSVTSAYQVGGLKDGTFTASVESLNSDKTVTAAGTTFRPLSSAKVLYYVTTNQYALIPVTNAEFASGVMSGGGIVIGQKQGAVVTYSLLIAPSGVTAAGEAVVDTRATAYIKNVGDVAKTGDNIEFNGMTVLLSSGQTTTWKLTASSSVISLTDAMNMTGKFIRYQIQSGTLTNYEVLTSEFKAACTSGPIIDNQYIGLNVNGKDEVYMLSKDFYSVNATTIPKSTTENAYFSVDGDGHINSLWIVK